MGHEAGSATPPLEPATNSPAIAPLFEAARAGGRGALARLLTLVERGGAPARTIAELAHPFGGEAYTLGITGAPGAGKSTLTNGLCSLVRAGGERLAVLAVDPSSPFSGGAILGDRVRMGDQVLDDGVFIRSMATRGHLGGLALATPSAIRLLDAVGTPLIVVETVGVGQVEIEIVSAVDTCVVVVNPGWGDAVQANKAGLMEIADIFVINKADRPGTAQTRADLDQMLSLRRSDSWDPPVVETNAIDGAGLDGLMGALQDHRRWLVESGELALRRERHAAAEFRAIVAAELAESAARLVADDQFSSLLTEIVERRVDPWAAADLLLSSRH